MATLRLEGLGKIYEGRVPVEALHDVNVQIIQGEYVAIVGPSGSGKSTLLNELALLDAPTKGEYFIDEVATGDLSDPARARLRSNTFAFIFQSFHLLDGRTVVDNVALGTLYRALPEKRRLEKAREALGFVGLGHKSDQKVQNLSGGEKQRVAIARAIASGAPVVVADEPTGNLDSKNSAAVIETLERLNQAGSTVIVVTHDPSVAARAPRRLEVLDGQVEDHVLSSKGATEQAAPVPEGHESRVRRLDALKDAWRGLWTKPGRTIALIAAVALGVGLALVTTGISQTAQGQVSEIFDAQRNQRVVLTSPTLAASGHALTSERRIAQEIASPGALERLQNLAGVEETSVFMNYSDFFLSTEPGADLDQVYSAGLVGMVDGKIPKKLFTVYTGDKESGVSELTDDQVILGSQLAAQLNLGPLLASPSVWIQGSPKEVVGILTDAGLQIELLNSVITTDVFAQTLASPQYASAEIRVVPGAGPQVALQGPVAWLPLAPESIQIDAPPDPTSMRDQIESNLATMLLTLTGVALLAAVLSLTSAMTTAVLQRTGEFGLRRAIGARRKHIVTLVLTESTIIGLIGGILGAYLSVLAVLVITIARQWQPVLDPVMIPLGIIGGVLVGLVGGAIATHRASRIQPSHALRA